MDEIKYGASPTYRKPKIENDYFPKAVKKQTFFTDPNAELEFYFQEKGWAFNRSLLGGHDKPVEEEFARYLAKGKTQADFWSEAEIALYHGIAFGEDQWKEPYRRILRELFPAPLKLLDYGCGVGSDGLKFQAAGYEVSFADLEGKSLEFLRWRLEQRGLKNKVYSVDIPKHDLVYAFDVIEHFADYKEPLEKLAGLGKTVFVNLLTRVSGGLHYAHSVNEVTEWINKEFKIKEARDLDYARLVIFVNRKTEV